MIDFNSSRTLSSRASDPINALVEDALNRKEASKERRAYLGASAIGGACERELQFELAQARREAAFKPATLKKFDLGHVLEELARGWFLEAGFDLRMKDPEGYHFRFKALDGMWQGGPDGVFYGGPQVDGVGYPCLWEHKGVGNKTFSAIKRDGLKKHSPRYYAQVQEYMAYFGLTQNPCIFTVTAAEDGEQQHLLVHFDAEEAQFYSDRAVRVVEATRAGQLLPRPFHDRTNFRCRACFFAERCWRLSA